MQAIVTINGKQFSVREGSRVKIPSLTSEVGAKVQFPDVLLYDDGKKVSVGNPTVNNVSVDATVLEHGRDRKILIYKKKRRKGYQRKNGHRQGYTLIEVNRITTKAAAKKKPAKKTAKPAAEEK